MKQLRIGIIGCADIAQRMMIPAINQLEQLRLVAVAGRSREKTKSFAKRFDCEAVVGYDGLLERDDIDAVYIPLPPGVHFLWTMKALAAGKHCLVEKPLGCNFAETSEMVECARRNHLALFENYMFVYHSQHQWVRAKLDNGEIGDIRSIRSSFGFPPLAADNFRYDKALGGGVLGDAGGYPLKACQLLLGADQLLSVKGAALKMGAQTGVDMEGGAFLVSPSGVHAQVSFGFDNFYQCNYEIWGSKGKITAHRAFTAGPGFKPMVTLERQDEYREMQLPADNHFAAILKVFHRAVIERDFETQYNEISRQARLVEEVREHAEKES